MAAGWRVYKAVVGKGLKIMEILGAYHLHGKPRNSSWKSNGMHHSIAHFENE